MKRLGYLPSPEHELLLKAGLLRDERALAAWRAWTARVRLPDDAVDSATYRLLPLVYHNLIALGLGDTSLALLRGIHRRTWYENQMRLRSLAELLNRFREAGMPTLVLKGAALALRYYDNVGLRPMDDVDLMVPTERAAEAIALLHRLGWRERPYREIRDVDSTVIAARHAWEFINAAGDRMDLHWHALFTSCFPGADEPFWHGAEPLTVGYASSLALNATDALLHTCAHGARWNLLPSVRWVSDAIYILRSGPHRIAWQRFVELADWLGVTPHVRDSLDYLIQHFDAPVPAEALAQLAANATAVPPAERRAYAYFSSTPANLLPGVARVWHDYRHYRSLWMRRTSSRPPIGLFAYARATSGQPTN
ncbi:MAG: nucleotidyltransferase family protein, partial [Anaerolineales bacterium]|nr:nucleotidyltransferase family protein [Anaerolineales bacterium]